MPIQTMSLNEMLRELHEEMPDIMTFSFRNVYFLDNLTLPIGSNPNMDFEPSMAHSTCIEDDC